MCECVLLCFVFHKMFKACILACDLGATTLSLLCKPEEQSSSVLSPGDDLIRSYCEFGRRHNELLLLVGSFPSHLVSRHLPISFETFLLTTSSSLFLSCSTPQTSLPPGLGPAPRPLSLVLPGSRMVVSGSGALHHSQLGVFPNVSGSRVVWYAHFFL